MFDDLVRGMDAQLISVMGVDAVWSRSGSMTVKCILDRDVVRANDYGEITRNSFEISILRPSGTQPAIDDTFTIAGNVYTVERIESDDGFIVKMAVSA